MEPIEALRRAAYLLERASEPTYKARAFRKAVAAIEEFPAAKLEELARKNKLTAIDGIGATTSQVIAEALKGKIPKYVVDLEQQKFPATDERSKLCTALRGECHMHSDWSDGGSSILDMAQAAFQFGHEWAVLTDHSPRLTVARGLSKQRLEEQLEVVEALRRELAPFHLLTGIEVDILDDGSLDQSDELLGRLDLVVASVHSKLKMDRKSMTLRMVKAIANPLVDVLGHCTGRLITGKARPESDFDEEDVFEAIVDHGKALEINSRPERLDPPLRLIRRAVELGCFFSIDTDAHAPGQLEWQINGCVRAEQCGVQAEQVINAFTVEELLAWKQAHRAA